MRGRTIIRWAQLLGGAGRSTDGPLPISSPSATARLEARGRLEVVSSDRSALWDLVG